MFTVIICDEHIIKDCTTKYHVYLKPLLNSPDFIFCKWNIDGASLDEAVPELKTSVKNIKEWRALIITDRYIWSVDDVSCENPFDYAGAVVNPKKFNTVEEIKEFREAKKKAYEKALTNPLTRLSLWLAGSPVKKKPNVEILNEYPDIDDKQYFEKFCEMCVDPLEIEFDRTRFNRYELLFNNFDKMADMPNPPSHIVALTERVNEKTGEVDPIVWKNHIEFDYSRFYEDNCYPDKLRYITYDLQNIRGERIEDQYFNFVTFMLLMANTEWPYEAIRANRVYNAIAEIDPTKISQLCNAHVGKLLATRDKISKLQKDIAEEESKPLDNEESRQLFEADIQIPVEINADFDKQQLMAKYDSIGLSKDCPTDEYHFWYNQSRSISKLFVRYLREPRRAVKKAATVDLRVNSTIDDDRILRMTENQLEDIEFRLQEEEQAMIETSTARIYETASCKKEIDEADKELRRKIGQRMTRKTTIIASLIAIAAYFLGFIPVLFSNLNNSVSSVFSLYFTLGAVCIFALIGFVCLIVLRKQLKDRFKHFNYVMSKVLSDIDNSLHAFSRYFSRMCNVMRAFFVIDYSKNTLSPRQKALKKHENDVNKQIDEVMRLFANYVDGQVAVPTNCEPYNYDFTVMGKYDYEMPYPCFDEEIEYMQKGNKIKVPVNFIKEVTLTREELYD